MKKTDEDHSVTESKEVNEPLGEKGSETVSSGNEEQLQKEESFQEIFESSIKDLKEGEVIQGEVIQITPDHIIVDVGYKSEGRIPVAEFQDMKGQLKVGEGDKVYVYLEEWEDSEKAYGELVQKYTDENGNPIEIPRNASGDAWIPSPPENFTSYTRAPNKYRTKGLTYTTFFTGEGDYNCEQMIFPTPSSFIIQGVIPGNIHFNFYSRTQSQSVKEILHDGQNITESGIVIQSGDKIENVTIVIKKR